VVAVPGFEILAAEARMNVHPYQVCTAVLPDYGQLVGLSVSRGYTRKVRELFGGPGGCSHVGALLQAMGPAVIQASWSLVSLDEDPAERVDDAISDEDRSRRLSMNTNTCHVWAEGSEHSTAVALGRSMRPDWEVERLRSLGIEVEVD